MTDAEAKEAYEILQAMTRNPETRSRTLRDIKTVRPQMVIPEVDARAEIEADFESKLKPLQEQYEALKRERMEDKIQAELERDRADVRKRFQLSDEDLKAVEQLMLDKKLPSHDSAAKVYLMERTPLSPRGFTRPEVAAQKGEDWRQELRNPKSRLFTDRKQYLNEKFSESFDDAFVKGLGN